MNPLHPHLTVISHPKKSRIVHFEIEDCMRAISHVRGSTSIGDKAVGHSRARGVRRFTGTGVDIPFSLVNRHARQRFHSFLICHIETFLILGKAPFLNENSFHPVSCFVGY